MAQSLAKIVVHLVFSTKERRPWLRDPERDQMHAYIGGILKHQDCPLIEINSVSDHVHVLFGMSKILSIAKIVEHVKTHSSLHLRASHPTYAEFHWQRGYGAFAVSGSHVELVRQYVRQQPEPHSRVSFQEEFRRLCQRNQVSLDERYAWD